MVPRKYTKRKTTNGKPKKAPPKTAKSTKPRKKREYPLPKLGTTKMPLQKLKNAINHLFTETKTPHDYHPNIYSIMNGSNYRPPVVPQSSSRIMYEMKNCLLNENWDGFAQLLPMLAENIERFEDIRLQIYKMYFIATIYDPTLKGTEYLQQCLTFILGCETRGEMEKAITKMKTLKQLHSGYKGTTPWQTEKIFSLPDLNLDAIDFENAENVLNLFNKRKRKVLNNHNPRAWKTSVKQ